MQADLADLRAIEADVPQGPIIEFRQLLNRVPVSPPRGEAPDERSEVHCRRPFVTWGPPMQPLPYVCC